MKNNLKKTVSAGGIVRKIINGKIHIVLIHEPERPAWILPKGHVKKHETLKQTALREVREETSLQDIKIVQKLGIKKRVSFQGDEYKTVHYFLFDCGDNKKLEIFKDNGNIIQPKWFPIDSLPELFWPGQKEIIKDNLNTIKAFKHDPSK